MTSSSYGGKGMKQGMKQDDDCLFDGGCWAEDDVTF